MLVAFLTDTLLQRIIEPVPGKLGKFIRRNDAVTIQIPITVGFEPIINKARKSANFSGAEYDPMPRIKKVALPMA
jgi:hypothetical protein